MDKETMYDKGFYRFKAPPVCTAYWNRSDWIKFIDSYNGWITPEQITENERKIVDKFYALHF